MESKPCTPSVIAKLMGLDELPPQQPVISKPQRVLSEHYLLKSASIGLIEKRSYHENRLFKVNYAKGKEFLNLFEEGQELPTVDTHYLQTNFQGGKANSSTTEVNMSFVREEKFTDAKDLSMDQKLWHTIESDDVIMEEVESDKDLLPRYLQRPYSLLANHLHDFQFSQPHSQSGHATTLKSLNAPCSRKSGASSKSQRRTARRNILRPLQKLENGFVTDSCGDLDISYTRQLLKSRLELKDDTCLPPSRIVKDSTHLLVFPNIGKAQNVASPSFSPISEEVSQPCERKHVEFSKIKKAETPNQEIERKNPSSGMEPSRQTRHSLRVSREFAEGMPIQIMHSISSSLTEVSRTELRINEASTNETQVIMPSSKSFIDWKNRCQFTYPQLNQSSFAKQDKKRLLERWKMTKRLELGVATRGTSLSEMLAMHDQEARPRNLNYKLDISGLNKQLSPNDGDAGLGSRFGISSSDGWKKCSESLTRLESIPVACSSTIEIPKSRTRNKDVCNDIYLKLEESVTQGNNKPRKQNFSQDSSERVLKFSTEKDQIFPCTDSRNNQNIQESCAFVDELENKIEKEDLSKEGCTNCNLSGSSVPHSDLEYDQIVQGNKVIHDELKKNCGENDLSQNSQENSASSNLSTITFEPSSLGSEVVAILEAENVGMLSDTPDEQQSEPLAGFLFMKDGQSSHVLDASVGQESSITSHEKSFGPSSCSRSDPEYPMRLAEGYSPSPNSVLEPPFSEEILSGSECFQDVGSDLHGFQTQLQLLKSESEDSNSEEPGMAVSSDEDSGDGSVDLSEENRKLVGLFRAEESRDSSYLVDVLDEAGFHGSNMQLGFEAWHSPDCPVNPLVFEMLEKKYGKQTSWEKSERRLLFDLVNLGLKEILQSCLDVLTRAQPLRKRFKFSQSREVIEEELWMFLVSQEKEVSKHLSEKALGTEIRWSELRDDIDLIVCEIERFLFDELAVELVSTESF